AEDDLNQQPWSEEHHVEDNRGDQRVQHLAHDATDAARCNDMRRGCGGEWHLCAHYLFASSWRFFASTASRSRSIRSRRAVLASKRARAASALAWAVSFSSNAGFISRKRSA